MRNAECGMRQEKKKIRLRINATTRQREDDMIERERIEAIKRDVDLVALVKAKGVR